MHHATVHHATVHHATVHHAAVYRAARGIVGLGLGAALMSAPVKYTLYHRSPFFKCCQTSRSGMCFAPKHQRCQREEVTELNGMCFARKHQRCQRDRLNNQSVDPWAQTSKVPTSGCKARLESRMKQLIYHFIYDSFRQAFIRGGISAGAQQRRTRVTDGGLTSVRHSDWSVERSR